MGNAECAKAKIEKIASSFRQVGISTWDEATHLLIIAYKNSLDTENLMQKLAGVVYDNECFTAKATDYVALHSCCKYR